MKNRERFRRKIRKVLVITLCWTLLVSFFYINNYFFVKDLIDLQKVEGNYAFWPDFTAQIILGLLGGLLGGYLLVFRMEARYKRRSFAFGIVNSGLLFIFYYLVVAVAGLFIIGLIYRSFQTDLSDALKQSWHNVLVNLRTPSFFSVMILAGVLVSGTQFMLQVNDKFGSGILWKFIIGKYYLPRQEERIFMFLDLKSSTTIAEKIGSKQFFEMIREIFQDITEPITDNLGEIYQYVGDEVIVSWPVDRGTRENNCLACFFDIERKMAENQARYLEKYGQTPTFKAGLHIGEATVGEIGVIKKDIVFSGDVLNTASRIQGECNRYDASILVSSDLLERMPLNRTFETIPMGEIHLRGKANKVALNTVKIRPT